MNFTNPATEAAFTIVGEKDQKVFMPGKENVHGEYYGLLSNIPPKVAERLIEQESNLITPKKTVTVNKPEKPDNRPNATS